MERILGFGERIVKEREATKLNQTAFGAVGGKSRNVQIRYEHEETEPPLSYLINIAKIGVDVQYIVTGERKATSTRASMLVTAFESAPDAIKESICKLLDIDINALNSANSEQVNKATQGSVVGSNNIVGDNSGNVINSNNPNISVGSVVKGSGNTVNVDMNKKNGKK